MDNFDPFLRDWSAQKTINGKNFDEIFQIEGTPLWWFYRRLFVAHVTPQPLNFFQEIDENKKAPFRKKMWASFYASCMGRYLLWNEKRKIRFFLSRQKKQLPKDGEKDAALLFLTYSTHLLPDGNIFRLQNMFNAVKNEEKIRSFVLFADPLSSRQYRKLKTQPTIYEYFDENCHAKASAHAQRLFQSWCSITDNEKQNLLTMENSVTLWPYLQYQFKAVFSQEFLYLTALNYEICKKIIEQENVKAIVVTSQSGFFEKCLLAAAFLKKVPVFQVQHGMGTGGLDTTYPTKRLVFSDYHKQELIKTGVDEKDISVTGPIVFDDVSKHITTNLIRERIILRSRSFERS